jgi:hypothetical protein
MEWLSSTGGCKIPSLLVCLAFGHRLVSFLFSFCYFLPLLMLAHHGQKSFRPYIETIDKLYIAITFFLFKSYNVTELCTDCPTNVNQSRRILERRIPTDLQ